MTNQNIWNTIQGLGLLMHLSSRLMHWMGGGGQGWHLASWLKGGNYIVELSWNELIVIKTFRYANFSLDSRALFRTKRNYITQS